MISRHGKFSPQEMGPVVSMPAPSAADIIASLDLKPHPEGGYYRETFRDTRLIEGRAASTAILFLLARAWQAAESLGDWTLVGCTVAPGFEFSGFELAPKDWKPAR
jgi:predicted cupin superfamily sugar epimerase